MMKNTFRIESHWPNFAFFSSRIVEQNLTREEAERLAAIHRANAEKNGHEVVYSVKPE